MTVRRIFSVALPAVLALLAGATTAARGAEYDVNGPSLELRRIQFCRKCDDALVVTTVPPGEKIICPTCNTVQRRLKTERLLTRLYQVCPYCGARMDVSKFTAGQEIRCGTCGNRQRVLAEAVYRPDEITGTGRPPAAEEVPAAIPPDNSGERPPPANAAKAVPEGPREAPSIGEEDIGPDLIAPGVFDDTRPDVLRKRIFKQRDDADTTGENDLDGLRKSSPEPVMPDKTDTEGRPATDGPEVLDMPGSDNGARKAALVNGKAILVADVEQELAKAYDALRMRLGRAAFTPRGRALMREKRGVLRARALERLIDRALVAEAARSEGIAPTNAEVLAEAERLRATGGAWRDAGDLLDAARTNLLLRQAMRTHAVAAYEIPPAEIRAFYDQHRNRFKQPERVRVRALVVYRDREGRADPRSAREIAAEIVRNMARGDDFETLIERYSESPMAERGGAFPPRQGVVPVALLAGPVQDLLENGEAGKVLGPVLLAGSVAFVRIEEMLDANVAPLEEVSEQIRTLLREDAAEAAFDRWLERLRHNAAITVF